MTVRACTIPEGALLGTYAQGRNYTDCYTADIAGAFDLAAYVAAFYTTPLFRLERTVLILVGKPSRDHEAQALAAGTTSAFAAWTVEARTPDQLLVCDFMSRTRSWFMVEPGPEGMTRLYFGTAITPARGRKTIGLGFQALLGFHKLYSHGLLHAARSRLQQR